MLLDQWLKIMIRQQWFSIIKLEILKQFGQEQGLKGFHHEKKMKIHPFNWVLGFETA